MVFLDETGFLMMPLVRRSWAPRSRTASLYQRTQSHKKVSVIAVLSVSPGRDRIRLYFRLHPDANINAPYVLDFLKNLSRQLKSPMVLLWDLFLAHKAKRVQSYIRSSKALHSEFLPPYAPELNPVENVWGYIKRNPMAHDAPYDLLTLAKKARRHGYSLQKKLNLLRSFVKHTPLFLRLK
ncbi:MAG: transposase [Deltaproteobacteria bacterium]|nr:transposase [Deltaproteobacteria bacterium]